MIDFNATGEGRARQVAELLGIDPKDLDEDIGDLYDSCPHYPKECGVVELWAIARILRRDLDSAFNDFETEKKRRFDAKIASYNYP